MPMLAKILDFAPALAFFISYRLSSDLVLATGVIIACCVLSFVLQYILWHKISRMQVFLTAAVLLFGIPTILLNDPQIIKWKVTVVNLILAGAIFVCQFLLHRNPFAYLFEKELPLPRHIWDKLGYSFMVYFVFAAGLNVIIAFYLPQLFGIDDKSAESLWVVYKTFGNAILNFVFALGCIFILMRRYPDMLDAFKEKAEPAAATATTSATAPEPSESVNATALSADNASPASSNKADAAK